MKRMGIAFLIGLCCCTDIVSAKECYANYECDVGSKCVKQPNQRSGVCAKVGDNVVPKPSSPLSPSADPLLKPQQCSIDIDCPIGFSCDKTYKLCIKRKQK